MNENDNEKFYDEKVAPLLAKLAKSCGERNMPFLAAVGNGKDHFATQYMVDDQSAAMRLVWFAIQAKGNLDLFMEAAERDAAKYGDNSCYLEELRHYRRLIGVAKA